MTAPVRFGFKLGGQDVTADEMRTAWQIADDAGFDHLWCLDLYVSIGPGGPDRPIFEGWAMQAAMAAATKRIRIGCTFTGNTHRPPWMLAKLAVTVDHLSGGRLEFGIGAGYEENEHRMYDIGGLDHRVGRLGEALECLRLLWTEERADFAGRYYTLRDAVANPKPIQKPHPPIWIGAGGDQTLRLVARHADVWNLPGSSPHEGRDQSAIAAPLAEAKRKLAAYCAEIGRDPASIRGSIQIPWDAKDPAWLLETSARWLEAGLTEQIVYLEPHRMERGGTVRGAEIAARMLPELRKLAPTTKRGTDGQRRNASHVA
jgi:alkanesulfonate monooxygenase SsuD/methylene tetrahydromethanopterin reductase-like flavin-dependent oxidoreductase (luciferase family)